MRSDRRRSWQRLGDVGRRPQLAIVDPTVVPCRHCEAPAAREMLELERGA